MSKINVRDVEDFLEQDALDKKAISLAAEEEVIVPVMNKSVDLFGGKTPIKTVEGLANQEEKRIYKR